MSTFPSQCWDFAKTHVLTFVIEGWLCHLVFKQALRMIGCSHNAYQSQVLGIISRPRYGFCHVEWDLKCNQRLVVTPMTFVSC